MRRNECSCEICQFCEGMNEYGKWICNYQGHLSFITKVGTLIKQILLNH